MLLKFYRISCVKKGYEHHESYVCSCCKDYCIVLACYSGELWILYPYSAVTAWEIRSTLEWLNFKSYTTLLKFIVTEVKIQDRQLTYSPREWLCCVACFLSYKLTKNWLDMILSDMCDQWGCVGNLLNFQDVKQGWFLSGCKHSSHCQNKLTFVCLIHHEKWIQYFQFCFVPCFINPAL